MRRFALLSFAIAAGAFTACGPEVTGDEDDVGEISSAVVLNTPRGGDPVLGRELVLNNGRPAGAGMPEKPPYLSCGIPMGVVTVMSWFGIDVIGTGPKLPERKRGMANLPYFLTTTTRPNGVEVLSSSCLFCHASKLGDKLIVGLPNPNLDFTQDQSMFGLMPLALDGLSLFLTPEENVELARYRRVAEAGYTVPRPDTKGVNAADVAFGIIAAHRDQSTLEWRAESKPEAHLGRNLAYTDVPAWWNVRRRDRMFYSGVGQGSHARIMMSAALMCLDNNAEAAEIDEYFGDVEAFILSLRPPRYVDVAKRSPDSVRAAAGRTVFMNTCSGCHGDSQNEVPPVLTVPAAVVGTDPLYATNASANGDGAIAYYFDFFNGTWFGTQGDAGRVERTATPVYSPPPLDGIWATAPYFHNASVPTLEAVLNPALRPRIYRRSFKPEEYQFGCTPSTSPCTKVVGWPYTTLSSKGTDTTIYDTTRAGYGNQGHTFAAGLTDAQRRDLLEYLKTL